MDLNLAGKVAVVSGGATGIGKAVVKEYIKEGVQVCVFARRAEVLEAFAKECEQEGAKIYTEVADVRETEQVRAFAARVYEKFGRIDIWVNNAGAAISREISDFTEEEFDTMCDTNFKAVFQGIQIAAEYMKKQGSGVILNASSFATIIPHANGAIYAATKAAVSSLTQTTGAALAPYGIRVVGYIPGMIQTELSAEIIARDPQKCVRDISAGRVGQPEDLAKPLVFLSSDAAGYITAVDIQISGGKLAVQDPTLAWRMKEEREAK